MTITKIISGGQTGADQGALDAAIKLGIPYDGWIPKGRRTENGPLPNKYQLQEMPTAHYPKRTKKNIMESDGTLIISHGPLTGGSALAKEYADGLERPCLHIDLDTVSIFKTALTVVNWIQNNDIKILNVTGPRASKDPKIHDATMDLLKSVNLLSIVHDSVPDLGAAPRLLPKTVDEAVERLISELPLKERASIANMAEIELNSLNIILGQYIQNNFGLWTGNEDLINSCKFVAGKPDLHPGSASQVIIDQLWKKLRETHKLRVVK